MRLRASSLPKRDDENLAALELERRDGSYVVSGFDLALNLKLNGKALEFDEIIEDGDELRIENSPLLITFYPIRSLPAVVGTSAHEAHVAPFIEQAALESAATARRDDAKVFLREFTRELVKEINEHELSLWSSWLCWLGAVFISASWCSRNYNALAVLMKIFVRRLRKAKNRPPR